MRAQEYLTPRRARIDAIDAEAATLAAKAPSFKPPPPGELEAVLSSLDGEPAATWFEFLQRSPVHRAWHTSPAAVRLRELESERQAVAQEIAHWTNAIRRTEAWSASVGESATRWTLDTWRPDVSTERGIVEWREHVLKQCEAWLASATSPKAAMTSVLVLAAEQTGVGKSHMACALCRELVFWGRSVVYWPVRERFADVRRSFGAKGSAKRDLVVQARDADVLFLDDLGAHTGTHWELDVLYEVLEQRARNAALTIVTANVDVTATHDSKVWQRVIGGERHASTQSAQVRRIASRLSSGADLIPFVAFGRDRKIVDWPDVRAMGVAA